MVSNPSKRNEKAKFLIHIGNGFVVSSYCLRLDRLEHSVFGVNTPDEWLMELCHDCVQKSNPNDSCYYKSFIVEMEITSLTRAQKYDSSTVLLKLKEDKEKLWAKRNKNTEINPSKRDTQ
jgi:hypothetical protein